MEDVKRYWSRFPGKFVTRDGRYAGDVLPAEAEVPKFKGTVREWCETLVETIVDCLNDMHKKAAATGGPCNLLQADVYASKQACVVLECSVLFKLVDDTVPTVGPKPIGRIAHFKIWEDESQPRDTIAVVATYNTLEQNSQLRLRGTVEVLDVPENGRKA